MLKTCSVCGGMHEEDKMCKRLYNKKIDTKAVSFRNSYDWRLKRTQIKVRDMYLCQVCLKEKHDTNFKYNHMKPPLLPYCLLQLSCSCHRQKASSHLPVLLPLPRLSFS